MKTLSEKFANVPVDEDTRIKTQHELTIDGIDALHQKWVWDGVVGESIIFTTADVAALSDEQLRDKVQSTGMLTGDTNFTLKRSDTGFVFVNFGFVT